jgi:hypothetical protein
MFGKLSRLMILGAAASGIVFTTLPTTAAMPPSENIQLSTADAQRHFILRGFSRGTVALFQNVGDRDVQNNRCMGYGNLDPDHVVEIQGKMSTLKFQVKTQQQQDTTIVVQGPNNVVYCSADAADGSGNTTLTINNFKEGTYKVWVGALDAGKTFRYSLSLQGQ